MMKREQEGNFDVNNLFMNTRNSSHFVEGQVLMHGVKAAGKRFGKEPGASMAYGKRKEIKKPAYPGTG